MESLPTRSDLGERVSSDERGYSSVGDAIAPVERSALDAIREALSAMESLGADESLFRANLAVALSMLAARLDRLYHELGL